MTQYLAEVFNPLWDDLTDEDSFTDRKPLLAHYTSISTLELIMKNDEVWLSNPLYMNDLEELRFGLNEGAHEFHHHEGIKQACGEERWHNVLTAAFDRCYDDFARDQAFDTYVMCFSEHDRDDVDGRLSMWRGYGSNGNGAAIVFDTAQVVEHPASPLIIAEVKYMSHDLRMKWISTKLNQMAGLLAGAEKSDHLLRVAAEAFLERLKIFSLFTKHHGFIEEREWRMVYLIDRDQMGRLASMLHYAVGGRGVEPKLKFKVAPIPGITAADLSLEKLIWKIILGPSVSSPLAVKGVHRMLQRVGKGALTSRVLASSTPFRST